jgi:hypothetical protein
MHAVFSALENLLIAGSQWIRPYLLGISLAISATLLAIYGSSINGWVKELVNQHVFVVRLGAFILLVAFGYGAANLAISHLVARLLARVDDLYLLPLVLLVFITIGTLAEHEKHI